MILEKQGYSYNDVTVVPQILSGVESRSHVNPFYKDNKLPIFTAPMSTVVNTKNFEIFEKNGITPILPRNIDIEIRKEYLMNGKWVALSLSETKEIFIENKFESDNIAYICIDIANGHMMSLIDLCVELKFLYGRHIVIMTGNIANPETIIDYQDAGIDYVRVGIGGGLGCTTTSNTSIHYPMASLIDETYRTRQHYKINWISSYYGYDEEEEECEFVKDPFEWGKTKIIADGGIRNYDDVIKALALGADYVMVGSLFCQFFESAAEFSKEILEASLKCKSEEDKREFINKYEPQKVFYGMSTKKAQKMIKSEAQLKTAEGTEKHLDVKWTMKQWVDNMESYLRSAMSYCSAFDLKQFIGKQKLIINSPAEIAAVNK